MAVAWRTGFFLVYKSLTFNFRSLSFTQEPLGRPPAAVVPAQPVTLHISGQAHTLPLAPWTTLLDALREHLHPAGTKKGCDHGQRINACLTLAPVY